MIVVATNTSYSRFQKSSMTCSSCPFVHPTMGNRITSIRNKLLQLGDRPINRLDPIVDVEHLPFSQQFPANCRRYRPII